MTDRPRCLSVSGVRLGLRWAIPLLLCTLSVTERSLSHVSIEARQAAVQVVEDPRPVAKAMSLLSRQLGVVISYEDPPWVNQNEILDITKKPLGDRRLLIPRGGTIQVPNESVVVASRQDPMAVIDSVLGREQTRGGTKRFRVQQSGTMFQVIPERFIDASGLWQDALPILDTTVTISHRDVSLMDFVQLLCAEISVVRSETVKPGSTLIAVALRTKVPAQERTAPARRLLEDAISAAGVPLTWLLFYAPDTKDYALNVVPPGRF